MNYLRNIRFVKNVLFFFNFSCCVIITCISNTYFVSFIIKDCLYYWWALCDLNICLWFINYLNTLLRYIILQEITGFPKFFVQNPSSNICWYSVAKISQESGFVTAGNEICCGISVGKARYIVPCFTAPYSLLDKVVLELSRQDNSIMKIR